MPSSNGSGWKLRASLSADATWTWHGMSSDSSVRNARNAPRINTDAQGSDPALSESGSTNDQRLTTNDCCWRGPRLKLVVNLYLIAGNQPVALIGHADDRHHLLEHGVGHTGFAGGGGMRGDTVI